MKKQTKGAIAAGAAALLLAGGAGTMAAWSTSDTLGGGGSVTAGNMTITQNTATPGAWTWATSPDATTAVGSTFDPDADRIVPGDKITYTANYDIVLVGNNLKASLTAEVQDIEGALAPYLDATTSEVRVGGLITPVLSEGTTTATVATTITFDPNTDELKGATESANLGDATVVLKQTAPAA